MFIIYLTTCLVNGKIYIGQHEVHNLKTFDPWYVGSGKILLKAIEKYGISNFERKILCKVKNQYLANKTERYFIAKYNSTNPSIGYNIVSGAPTDTECSPLKIPSIAKKVADANRGKVWSQEIKDKISRSVSKTMTKERRKLISQQHKGKIVSERSRRLISNATKGKNNPMYGKRGKLSPMFGRKWITNGEICRFIDISNGIPQGFRLGRK